MTSPQVMDADVERALQHAIGQANGAFATGLPSSDFSVDAPRKKKRNRENPSSEGEQPKHKKRKKKTHRLDELKDVPTLAKGTAGIAIHQGEAVKTKEKRKNANAPSTQAYHEAPASAIDLSALLGNPSLSASPSQTAAALISTVASTSGNHLPADQLAQDLYYAQAARNFPNFHSEDDSLLQANTNDDILRAFQELDLTRLAVVLRGLDLPLSPSQPNAQLDDALHDDANASFLDQMFSACSNIENTTSSTAAASSAQPSGSHGSSGSFGTSNKRPPKALKPVPQRSPNLGPSIASPEHTDLLATKWLSAAKLKSLVETEGLVYKKGKFSITEEQALKAAIENYRESHSLSAEEIIEVIFSKSKDNTFWPDITASVPARPLTAVYHHVRRIYHPLKYQGKWSKEEDAALLQAVADHGQAWQKISDMVGRMAQDCRDRWKNHLAHSSERQHGRWTKKEEEELTRIVTEMTTKQGKNSDNDIFWGVVSQRMGNKRGRQQCRIKWTDSLNKIVKNSGNTPRWRKQDSFILVHKVASLDIRDESEIDWNTLPDPGWNLWSAHAMQRRWRSIIRSINGHETMAFGDIVDILHQKYSKPTLPPPTQNKMPKSTEMIEEDEDEDEDDDQPVV